MKRSIFCYGLALTVTAVALCTAEAAESSALTVAFVGDQGTGENARAVLQLIADEGTDLLLIQGDLGYDPDAATSWIANIDEILGDNFPVLLSVGNHENHEWPAYQRWQQQRIQLLPELQCQGDPGVKAHCSFRGVSVVQIAPGVDEVAGVSSSDDYADFLDDALSDDANVWRICSWHKNQQDMQVGGKLDATGWDVYAACRQHGGIIATAHEHSYSRTFLMSNFEAHDVVHRGDLLEVRPGQTFAFVSGLGGRDIREQEHFNDWWASVYSSTQDARHGVLFCTLNDDLADCYFKDIEGNVPDRFMVKNGNAPGSSSVVERGISTTGDLSETTGTRSGRFDSYGLMMLCVFLLSRRGSIVVIQEKWLSISRFTHEVIHRWAVLMLTRDLDQCDASSSSLKVCALKAVLQCSIKSEGIHMNNDRYIGRPLQI